MWRYSLDLHLLAYNAITEIVVTLVITEVALWAIVSVVDWEIQVVEIEEISIIMHPIAETDIAVVVIDLVVETTDLVEEMIDLEAQDLKEEEIVFKLK
jgi:hypothetical protein